MALDYILENDGEHFLETIEEKRGFFLRLRGVPSGLVHADHGHLRPFLSNFPISLADRTQPATSVVRFPFMDEGLLSTRKFTRFLNDLGPLMLALKMFEVIYIAASSANFLEAKAAFRKAFEMPFAHRQQILQGFGSPSGQHRSLSSRPAQARFTTLLFHFSYPQLLRNEPRGSVPRSVAGSIESGGIA